jgi:hypothetical protein
MCVSDPDGIRIHSGQCTATAIPFIHSFSGNCLASAPVSTFMCLWAIYIFPGSVHIFPPAEKADPSWKYIIRSQTHEWRNWDWGPDIPFLGLFVSNFRHFVFAVWVLFRIGFGIRNRIRTQKDKNDPQKWEKNKKFHVLKCWMFFFEGWRLLL